MSELLNIRKRVAMALLSVGALSLTACSQNNQSSEASPTPTVTVTVTATPEEVASEQPTTTSSTPTSGSTPEIQLMRSSDSSIYRSNDETYYTTPWMPDIAGQVMIPFGCTDAPYYNSDPSCPENPQTGKQEGKHHGVDIYADCGTAIVSPYDAIRLSPQDAPNPPGNAYGTNALRLRIFDGPGGTAIEDVIIGHTRDEDDVAYGQAIQPGDTISRVSDDGAPDGCHLHFETRPVDGSVKDATNPAPFIMLEPVDQ